MNNASEYYYIRNGQNEIIGILDSTGAQVVSYSYDTWGKPVSTTGTLASTIGAMNPFRYRGYYYDESSGLYYLNSRYYDANMGRFINADGVVGASTDLSSFNMFSYCGNNPVVRSDPNGKFWLFALVVSAVILAAEIVSIACGAGELFSGLSTLITAGFGISNLEKNIKEDLLTHTENVVGFGSDDPSHTYKEFTKPELVPNPEEYIEHCKKTYDNLVIIANSGVKGDLGYKKDFSKLTWSQMTEEEHKYLSQQMQFWDHRGFTIIQQKYHIEAFKITWDAAY